MLSYCLKCGENTKSISSLVYANTKSVTYFDSFGV